MLNKEFLLLTKRVPSFYDEFHSVVGMREETTKHYVWDYSEDINNVVGGRIPWWVNPNNFFKKNRPLVVDIYLPKQCASRGRCAE